MIYDAIIDLFKLLVGSVELLKPFAVPFGILVLLLKQNNIRKMVNGQLPKRFRDTHEADLQEIRNNVRDIKRHLEVPDWSSQPNGSEIVRTPTTIIYYIYSLASNIQRRLFKMSKWISRKFLMAILAAVLPIINEQFNLGLDTNVVIAAIGGIVAFILGESHIDAKRAGGSIDAIPTANTESNK